MKVVKRLFLIFILCLISFALINAASNKSGGKKLNKTTLKAGDAYRMFINNISLPLDRQGVIGDVLINGAQYGQLDGKTFLFSGGFFLSGKTNGKTWANGVASASRIQDYVPGTIESGRNDSRAQLYVLKYTDGDFSDSWNEWKDAVALGANFYDGDGDGIYNPVDKNGNGKWDPTEDRPDLIGDETVWCVYNDGISPALREFNDVVPQGIEIRQSVFGFNSKSIVGNMLFVRYSILNTGTVANEIDSVYFGVWADPDLGDPNDDLVGCDTILNAGYVYGNKRDAVFGNNPPCFLIDFFQGPLSYIPGVTFTDMNGNGKYDEGTDIPLTTAHNVQGKVRGVASFPGAKNLGLSSFVHYMQSHPTLGDPSNRTEARNYMLGKDKKGDVLDPCSWPYGSVMGGENCTDINNKFWYSGDPVKNTGWINNTPIDQRQMSNTGPFKLEKGKPIDIVVAYIVGRSNINALESVDIAKEYSIIAQKLFDNNFPSPPPPPPVKPVLTTGDGFIDITWNTSDQIKYREVDTLQNVDRRVQGFTVTAFKTNSKSPAIGGVENAMEIANYELNNKIKGLYAKAANGGVDLVLQEASSSNKLDSLLQATPGSGRISLRIASDPFTGSPLIKGKEYYFSITQYTLNHKTIVNKETGKYGGEGDYYDPTGGALEQYETQIIKVTYGKDLYDPAFENKHVDRAAGRNGGEVQYLIIDKSKLTGDDYSVEFFKDGRSQNLYVPFWKLTNTTKNQVVVDSSKIYDYDTVKYAGIPIDGFLVKIKPMIPQLGTPQYIPAKNQWFTNFDDASNTGAFYAGKDAGVPVQVLGATSSNIISADRMKQVEIRFGDKGKAYRYLNGYIGNNITRRSSFVYAAGVTASDTVKGGAIGKLGEGFVDVPFTAWARDSVLGIEKQLAVGFIETGWKGANGSPDGKWEPGDSVKLSMEYIIIFDAPYDPTGSQIQYTGGTFNTNSGQQTIWADVIKGLNIPPDAQNITEEQRNIAASSYFDALYVVGLQSQKSNPLRPNKFTIGDKLIIPVNTYPYTSADKFTFKTRTGGALTADEKKALFDKVNVFPNPLFAYNPATNFDNGNSDEPFVTFSNLPTDVSVKIYTLSGTLVRTLGTLDKSAPTSPFLRWNLENESRLRVASGLYLAIVSTPGYGDKVLKFSIIMPQKQIQKF